MSASAPAPRAQRGILACAGGTLAPHAPPAPSRRAHRARARARVRLEGLGCAARPAAVRHDPRAGGARAHRDTGRGSTWSRDPPSHAPHARRARGGRARAPPWGLGVVRSGQLAAARCCGCRGPPVCLGGSRECVGHLSRVPGGLEREISILEAATEPPAAGFGAWRGVRRSGPHSEVRAILISILGHSGPSLYGSGASRVPIDRLPEAPLLRAPRRSARHAAQPTREHGGHARSSPTQTPC